MTLEEKLIETLKTVYDPEVQESVWDLKLIYDIDVDEESGAVSFKFRPTVPNCPIGLQLALNIKLAVRGIPGIGDINMLVTDFVMADEANEYLEGI